MFCFFEWYWHTEKVLKFPDSSIADQNFIAKYHQKKGKANRLQIMYLIIRRLDRHVLLKWSSVLCNRKDLVPFKHEISTLLYYFTTIHYYSTTIIIQTKAPHHSAASVASVVYHAVGIWINLDHAWFILRITYADHKTLSIKMSDTNHFAAILYFATKVLTRFIVLVLSNHAEMENRFFLLIYPKMFLDICHWTTYSTA